MRRAASSCAAASPGNATRTSGTTYDVAVVGLGAFGSAAAYHLSRLGARVAGVDIGDHPGHAGGSSHGATRIYRFAYREGADYLPLLRYSHDLFLQLEQESGQRLVVQTGILEVGANVLAGGSLAAARQHGLQHEVLTGAQLKARYPAYGVPDTWHAVLQPEAGMLLAEACIQAHCAGAERAGAQLLWGRRVRRWRPLPHGGASQGVELELDSGQVLTAGQLLLTAGPWIPQLLPGSQSSLKVVRQVLGWFDMRNPAAFEPSKFPVFILDTNQNSHGAMNQSLYGFPQWTEGGAPAGFKIGVYQHLNEEVTDPSRMNRELTSADLALLTGVVRRYFPLADPQRLLAHSACMFTNTPDSHFVVDRHPAHPQVLICSACSGHGFKMSSGVGRLLAEDAAAYMRTGMPAPHGEGPQQMLSLHRLSNGASRPWLTALVKALTDDRV